MHLFNNSKLIIRDEFNLYTMKGFINSTKRNYEEAV